MLENFMVVASQVGTLFLLMGVGYTLARLGRIKADGIAQMSFLALYVVTPCIIITSFETERTEGLGGRLLLFALLYALSTLVNLLVSRRCFRGEPPLQGNPLRFSMSFGNNGFMGLPLIAAVLGPEGLMFGVVSVVIFNFALWTIGVVNMGGTITLRKVLLNPATVGLAVGLPLFLTGWRLPATLNNALDFLSNLNTPLAMVVIGAQMAGANLKTAFTNSRLYAANLYRLILSPLLPLILLLPLGLDPILYCSMVIMCAVPVAGATGMLAQQYEQDTAIAAQAVTLSTLLSALTLPVMAVTAQALSGL